VEQPPQSPYSGAFATSTGHSSDQYYFARWPVLLPIGDQYWFDRWPVLVAITLLRSFSQLSIYKSDTPLW